MEILITGGTFDKEYNFVSGELSFMQTHLPEMLKRGRCSLDMEVRTLFMIDSLQMDDSHREVIAEACLASDSNQIVITHGTDSMVQTGLYLDNKEGLEKKTVVLTGAMIPYAFGTSSDGFFNLGSAISFAQVLSPGVYICMNGRYFPTDAVQKNYNTGFFEDI